jgi:hypothetical protein
MDELITEPVPAEDKPRKQSTSERYRNKIKAQASELEGLRTKLSRSQRMQVRVRALHGEVEQLETLAHTLLGHLEAAIKPGLTDAERIRYRCMINDIQAELSADKRLAA